MAIIEMSKERLPQFDGLRGLAILLVLIHHYKISISGIEPGSLLAYLLVPTRLAWSGVDLFFVLSGFLITGILLDSRKMSSFFWPFYRRRAVRILPLYFLCFGLFEMALILPLPLPSAFDDPLPALSYATFTQNILMAYNNSFGAQWMGPTWSLAVEEQFYLLFPLLIRYCAPRILAVIFAAIVALAAIFRALAPGDIFSYVLTPCRADALMLGALCALLLRDAATRSFVAQNRAITYAALAVLCGGAGVLLVQSTKLGGMPSLGYSWLTLLYACLLIIAATETRGPIASITRWAPLRSLGTISYGVYLVHAGSLALCHFYLLGHRTPIITGAADAAVTLLSGAITIGIAAMSWRFFEEPLLRVTSTERLMEAPQTALSFRGRC